MKGTLSWSKIRDFETPFAIFFSLVAITIMTLKPVCLMQQLKTNHRQKGSTFLCLNKRNLQESL